MHGRAVKVVRKTCHIEEAGTDDWRAFGEHMKADRQERHGSWKQQNFDAIKAAGIPHTVTNEGLCIVIREAGKPPVDFYPSTGRWRVVGKSPQTMGGHAEKFLKWYAGATA